MTARNTDHARHSRGEMREAELAARWAAGGWCGRQLRTEGGEAYRLVFQGRRGGGAGPDFRDAVLERADGMRLCGDVELHLRARDWQAHGHARDTRYNAVVLHVVLATSQSAPEVASPLASGASVPVVVLRISGAYEPPALTWPCAGLVERRGNAAVRDLLLAAGRDRFEARAGAFADALAAAETGCHESRLTGSVAPAPSRPRASDEMPPPSKGKVAETDDECDGRASWSPIDTMLFVALAEGLGYGRDRAALRDAGMRLALGDPPQALLSEAEGWPRVERARLRGLVALHVRWHIAGPWYALREVLDAADERVAVRRLTERLCVDGGDVSPSRARILIANVVLPFAAAVAVRTGDTSLALRARTVYVVLGGLPSNQITREMRRQLGLPRLPAGAVAQQGLHHIWSCWCRDKHCVTCPCASDSASC